MKNYVFAVASAVLISLFAVSQSGVINEPLDDVASYSIIDPIIKAILEAIKPKLANLKIDPINETVRSPDFNASLLVNDILITNADKFVIQVLKSNVVPLKLANLTLTWNDITAQAAYDVNASIALPPARTPFNLYAQGKAKASLSKLFFTIGANVDFKNNALQIKPKGLFGFDLRIGSANVTISSLMGSSDLGNAVGVFISKMIPELVNTLKKPLFDAFQDDIINFINQILKNNGTSYVMNEEPTVPEFSWEGLDLSEELSKISEFQWEDLEFESEF